MNDKLKTSLYKLQTLIKFNPQYKKVFKKGERKKKKAGHNIPRERKKGGKKIIKPHIKPELLVTI